MQFLVEIERVQPITHLRFEVDLEPGLMCIAGKNGAGKTTLARSILNFAFADTFTRTASEGIFDSSSTIRYEMDGERYVFSYDARLGTVNTRTPVPAHLKRMVSVELPMPHGQRFSFFRTLVEVDHDIRRRIIVGEYERPERLIGFLSNIYGERKFENLIAVPFRGGMCCCTLRADGWYLREDYFSSGEYFLINLFKKISEGKRLVFVDEIDISLDARAQARLGYELRALCHEKGVKVVFTSHSLALMQTMEPGELYYLDRSENGGTITPLAFSFVKSLMFGFRGYDRFILTEDDVLKELLEYVIQRYCPPPFFSHVIVVVGSGAQVVEMMRRNRREGFLGRDQDVISILDGDQRRENAARSEYWIPILNLEVEFQRAYQQADFGLRVEGADDLSPKRLYNKLVREKFFSPAEIQKIVCDRNDAAMREFAVTLTEFLSRPG